MNVVITMGGLGTRFRQAGYNIPKYQIEVCGRTLFDWSMLSLAAFRQYKHIFLVRSEDKAENFIKAHAGALGIENHDIICLEQLTRGQAETAMLAEKCWDKEHGLLIYNIDTYVESGEMRPELLQGDGCIPCFHAEGEHWSFVKLDSVGKAVEVREKNRISDNCSIGAYYFRSCEIYKKAYNDLYEKGNYTEGGERYIAPMYNVLIESGFDIRVQDIETRCVHALGTPEEVEQFKKWYGGLRS